LREPGAGQRKSSKFGTNAEVWSLRRVLGWAAEDLKRRGNEGARLDVELLLGRVLGLDRIGLIMQSERVLAPSELTAFKELSNGGAPESRSPTCWASVSSTAFCCASTRVC